METTFEKSAIATPPAATVGGERDPQQQETRLRVLQVITRFRTGGTECGIGKLMLGLGHRFEQRVCAVRGADEQFSRLASPDAPPLVAGREREGFQFLVFRLARIMREFKPHIVHSRNWGTIEAIPAARLARVPLAIHSEHGYELDTLNGIPWRRRLLRRAAYAMADAVFTVSQDLRRYHARQAGIAEERIRVLHNGVDLERFCPRPEMRSVVRQKLGLPMDGIVLGTVGRMVPIKGQGLLLRAAATLIQEGAGVFVLLVGSGPELERHRDFVNQSEALRGRVVFAGESQQVGELLDAMDVFALPSFGEGMSNTALEAMASGLPVVATRVGGNPELVDEGHTGWLVAAGDLEGLTGRLRQLCENAQLRRQFGVQGRQRAAESFSLAEMLDNYRKLYVELAARHGLLPAPERSGGRVWD
jgi:sugar transferase (PEP-CTERM/EpsH1 system associated)